ncbi:MAG TPA: twin-arginine translocase TatA/TatE family subunit [Solirubrobacteraceae bacterium]|jgi:sec-independent protein translocase protein TatA|nr:twin-arginine translocase TatA/TatE family subunit [Solirubrobacteraceae bacterium]
MGLDNPLHIAFLVVILLLVFGAKRLPEIGKSLGSGMREFKDSVTGADEKPALTQAHAAVQPQPVQQAPAVQTPPQPEPVAAPAQPAPAQQSNPFGDA